MVKRNSFTLNATMTLTFRPEEPLFSTCCIQCLILLTQFSLYTSPVIQCLSILTHYCPVFPFYTPWKYQETADFLVFSRSIKREHRALMGQKVFLLGNFPHCFILWIDLFCYVYFSFWYFWCLVAKTYNKK